MRAAIAAALILACSTASGHDVYKDFWSGGSPGLGRWCCSGDLDGKTGDCSPASYKLLRNGDAIFYPKKYPGAAVLVPAHRILWMNLPDPEAGKYEAHLCAKPRSELSAAPTEDDPDPNYIVFCAAITPPGV